MEDNSTYADQFTPGYQRHLLACLVRTPGFISRFRTALDHQYFSEQVDRRIAKAALKHVDEFSVLPTRTTLIEFIRDEVSDEQMQAIDRRVSKLYDDDTSDAPSVMKRAVEFGQTMAMANAVVEGAELVEKGRRKEVRGLIEKALTVGEDLIDTGINIQGCSSLLADWYVKGEDELDMIPSGLPHLDLALGGGLGRGELGVFLAPPKVGKTTTLINVGFGSLLSMLGLNVVHYTMEMKAKKVVMRYHDRLAGPAHRYKTSDPERYIKDIADRTKKFIRGDVVVKQYNTRTAGISNLRAHLSLLAAEGFTPDLILVDYADIMKAERRMGDMRHEQAGIYEDLRALAGDYDAACWTASQANKYALEKEVLDIGDFAESFEKAAIVDAAIAFCQTQEEKNNGRARLVPIALRNADDGRIVDCRINRNRCLMRSIALLDPLNNVIAGEARDDATQDEEAGPVVTTRTRKVEAVKESVGIKNKKPQPVKKKPTRRRSPSKRGPAKGTPKKGPTKSRAARPDKNIAGMVEDKE